LLWSNSESRKFRVIDTIIRIGVTQIFQMHWLKQNATPRLHSNRGKTPWPKVSAEAPKSHESRRSPRLQKRMPPILRSRGNQAFPPKPDLHGWGQARGPATA